MRRRHAFFLVAALLAAATAASADSLRCGDQIVNVGDRTFQVLQWCGEPVSRQFNGYTLNARGDRELIIEEWVYGPKNGYYYFITFEGGKVTRISSEQQQK